MPLLEAKVPSQENPLCETLVREEFLAIVASRVANVRKSVELSRGGGRVPDRIIEISRLATLSAADPKHRTEIENLLVNPETNVVKDGRSDTSVFTVKAELLEEGFFLRSVRDEDAQEVRTIVEF